MKPTQALKNLLEELGTATHDEHVKVCLRDGDGSHADINGNYVQVDPRFAENIDPSLPGPLELRAICDVHSHEMEHIRTSDLEGKKEFAEEYPECARAAGYVYNVLEDEWVDAKRVRRYPGHKRSRALLIELLMDGAEPLPSDDDAEAYLRGLYQFARGNFVRGYDDAHDNVKAFLTDVAPLVEQIREEPDPARRDEICHAVMDALFEYVDQPDAPDERIGEDRAEEMDDAAENANEDTDGEELPDVDVDYEWDDEDEQDDDADDSDGGSAGDEQDDEDGDGDSDEGTGDGDSDGDTDADDADGDSDDGSGDADEDDDGGAAGDGGADDADADDETDGSATGSSDSNPKGSRAEDGDAGGDNDESDRSAATGGEDDRDFADLSGDENDVREKYGVDAPRETTGSDERKWERYQRKLNSFDSRIEERRRERDDRMDSFRGLADGEKLREEAKTDGVVRDIEEKFREYTTRDAPRTRDHGTRLDTRNVVRRAAGDYAETELYEHRQSVETGDRALGVALDISHSMNGDMDEAKIALAAIAQATEIIGDTFVATAYTDNGPSAYNHKGRPMRHSDGAEPSTLDLRLITGPDEEFDWSHLDSVTPSHNTPTAAGMDFTRHLMDDMAAREKLVVVLTDGKANITRDGHNEVADPDHEEGDAIEDCRAIAEDARQDGYGVVGIGIGSGVDDEMMADSFGDGNYHITSIDQLAGDLIELYESQLDDGAIR